MFALTICVLIIMFIIDLGLSTMNYKHRHTPIPENVADVYKKEDYEKWLSYTMEVFKVSIIQKIIDMCLILGLLILGIFPKIALWIKPYTDNPVLQALIFLAVYSLISYIFSIGFSLYRTFNIEARYGFNTTTPKTYILDQIKSALLTTVFGGGLLYILLNLYIKMGNQFLFYAWLLVVTVTLVINLLYTRIFIRLFNKLTPLEEGDLYDAVQDLAEKTGYALKEISVMDASKRSSRLNAFFSGFGKFKHIILYDTLIEKCSTDEIVSVLAHEIGHAKHKDVFKNFLISIVQMAIFLGILTYFFSATSFATAFGFESIHYGFAIVLFGILMEPIGLLAGMPLSAQSRSAEYKADAYAAEVGYRDAMIQALKVLARVNFSNLTPHPLLVKLTYSHPPVSDRIRALEKS